MSTATTLAHAPALTDVQERAEPDFLSLFATSYATSTTAAASEANLPLPHPFTSPSYSTASSFDPFTIDSGSAHSEATVPTTTRPSPDVESDESKHQSTVKEGELDEEQGDCSTDTTSATVATTVAGEPSSKHDPCTGFDAASAIEHQPLPTDSATTEDGTEAPTTTYAGSFFSSSSDGDQGEEENENTVTMNAQEPDSAASADASIEDGASQLSGSDDAKSAISEASWDGDESTADFTEFFVGTSSIADPLKYIAMSFEDKCRELKSLTKVREKEAALLETLKEEKEQLQEALSESLSTRANLEEQVEQLMAELATLKEEVSHKDHLLATSDKISTSLFGVLMAAKSTLDSAGSLAPAMRSMSSAYAPSASATDDEDSDEDNSDDDDDDEDAQTADTDHEGADVGAGNTTLTADQKKVESAQAGAEHAVV